MCVCSWQMVAHICLIALAAKGLRETTIHFIPLFMCSGFEANSSIGVSEEDYTGPLPSVPSQETDYLLWFSWIFIIVCSSHIFISSQTGQRAIERINVLWQEHQHQHID